MLISLFRAVVQVADFLAKAAKTYAETPEGQAELYDIVQALQGDEDPESDNQPSTEAK